METFRHMFVLLTTGFTALMCQGCSGHMASNTSRLALSAPVQADEIAPGIRLVMQDARDAQPGLGSLPGFVGDIAMPSIDPGIRRLDRAIGPVAATSHDIVASQPIESRQFSAAQRTAAQNTLLGLEWSGADVLQAFEGDRLAAQLVRPLEYNKQLDADFTLAAPREQTGLAFDVGVAPSLSYTKDNTSKSRSFGAELRIGRDFDQRGTGVVADSWYVFAGAEGEALVWEAGEYGVSNVTGAVALRDQVTVGDLQAGLSVQRGSGQLSLSYIRREVQFSDRNGGAERNEDFAGLSFTLRK